MKSAETHQAVPNVTIVDDDVSLCKALTRLLQAAHFGVATHCSAQDFLEQYDPDIPGCLLLDLAMPGLNGLELQDVLTARGSCPPIVFLTGNATVPSSVRALKHGAVDFLLKPVDEFTLLEAVRAAIAKDHSERTKRSEEIKLKLLFATLTPREYQVLTYVLTGKLNKQIAGELGTVEKTVKVHRARAMEKLQVSSLAELVLLAARAGVTANASQKVPYRLPQTSDQIRV